MTDTTPRLVLPLLSAGQAQKELAHNEALALLDLVVQPAVLGLAVNDPPSAPEAGDCWVIGPAPTGAWAGEAGALAGWTEGGWRFVRPVEGMAVWLAVAGVGARYVGGLWTAGIVRATRVEVGGQQVLGARRPAIAAPAAGTVIDAEARATIGEILAMLVAHGLLSE